MSLLRDSGWTVLDPRAETSTAAFIALAELLKARRDRAATSGGGVGGGGRTLTVATSADGASHLATVVEIESSTRARVDLEGTVLPATVPPDQDKIMLGDTVQVGHQAGVWSVSSIITKHDPPPDTGSEMSTPSRPTISIPSVAAPTGSSVPSFNVQALAQVPITVGVGSAPGSYDPAWQNGIRNTLEAVLDALSHGSPDQNRWAFRLATFMTSVRADIVALQNAQNSMLNAINALRTAMSSVGSGLGAAVDYTEATGDAAAGAIAEGAAGGTKVQPFSLSAMPENIDRDGYAADNDATRTQIGRILNWRIRAILDLRAGVNRARKHQGLGELAAFPNAPDPVVDDVPWGTAAGMIQAVDDWASTRMLALVAAINEVRAKESLGRGTYSSGRTYAWSGGTYQAARPTLIVSMRNYRVWLEEAGTALKEPVGIINSKVPASSPQPQPATPQKRIIGISLSGMPDNVDKDAYAAWSEATRFQVTRILAWRTRTILDLHAAVNRARAYYSLAAMPARPTPPDPVVDDDTNFSTAAPKIQAVDDWASNALNAIVTGINQVRAQAGKGNGTWSGGVLAWSGSTYPTARASLIVSMRNYRIRCSESGTALMDVVNAVNNG